MNQEASKHILEHCWRWLFIMMYMHQMALLWGGGFLSGVFSSLRRYQCSCFKLELLNTADTGCSLHSVHIHFTRWHFYRDLNWVFSSCLMNYCPSVYKTLCFVTGCSSQPSRTSRPLSRRGKQRSSTALFPTRRSVRVRLDSLSTSTTEIPSVPFAFRDCTQKLQKSLKRWYYWGDLMVGNITFWMIFLQFIDPSLLTLWINCTYTHIFAGFLSCA